jgi:N-acetylglucosaminyl-diphospho-decaprenol L-rhamnosyltransferase
MAGRSPDPDARPFSESAELTVIIVSYKTRDLTLKAVETLIGNSPGVAMRIVLFDNASGDGSAEAVAAAFPEVEVIANPENIGFASANNFVARSVSTDWLLLLNPDTETYPNAIARLLAFGKAHPEAGISGGRTLYPDGRLNPSSCWQRMTPWSVLTSALGLSRRFPDSPLFNAEAMGGWRRDSVREVDIVVGCFLLIPTALWRRLGGFDARYFMYGEDADLCLRARVLGYRPMITPDAEIMHLVGASTSNRADKAVAVLRARTTLIRDHWPGWQVPIGIGLMWLAAAMRGLGSLVARRPEERARLRRVWRERGDWLPGFGPK